MKKNKGFTLIEIMIALLLGLIIVGTVLTIYISTIRGSSNTVKSARLNHDLEAVMALMINDIRRAGYWGGAITDSNAVDNPFTAGIANVQILDYTDADGAAHASGCVLYSYDENANGNYDANNDNVVDDNSDDWNGDGATDSDDDQRDEFYGFRLDRGVIWIRVSGTTTANCGEGSWQRLMDQQNVLITGLTFSAANYHCLHVRTTNSYASDCAAAQVAAAATADAADDFVAGDKVVETREIDISLTGRLVDDPAVGKTLTDTVRVRNDRHAQI